MEINKKSIVFLAKRYYFVPDDLQIEQLVFELNYLKQHFVKQWNALDFSKYEPLILPFFIKGNYLRSDNLIIKENKKDFFLNLKKTSKKGLVFISKTLKSK